MAAASLRTLATTWFSGSRNRLWGARSQRREKRRSWLLLLRHGTLHTYQALRLSWGLKVSLKLAHFLLCPRGVVTCIRSSLQGGRGGHRGSTDLGERGKVSVASAESLHHDSSDEGSLQASFPVVLLGLQGGLVLRTGRGIEIAPRGAAGTA